MSHLTRGVLGARGRRKAAAALVLAAALATPLAACTSKTSDDPAAAETLTYLEPQFFNTLYPPAAGFYPNGGVINNITDRLLYQDPETMELSPWIATELPEVNADATEYTFNIRTDVTYSDGTPLTAQNVVDNFDLFGKGDKSRTLTPSEQISNYDHGEVVDNDTVKFHFKAPAAGFAQATSSINAGLVSDSTLKFSNSEFAPGNATHVIGSGPFVIDGEKLGSELTLKAREDYNWAAPANPHQGRAKLDGIKFVLASEESVRVGGLMAGQADMARQIEAPEERHLTDRGLQVVAHGTNGVTNQLDFRFQHPLLTDIRTRQAIMHAIDRDAILRTLFSANYPKATSSLAATALGYKKQDDAAFAYDPELARRLLSEAGWSAGEDGVLAKDGRRLSLVVNEAVPQPRSREAMTKAQEQLAEVGIELSINPGDNATQNADSLDANKIQLRHTMVGRADYDVINSQYSSEGRNQLLNYDSKTKSFGDEKLEQMLHDEAAAPNDAERSRISGDIQDYLTEQAYVLPLFEEPVVYGLQPYVKGFSAESIGRPNFYGVWLDQQERTQ